MHRSLIIATGSVTLSVLAVASPNPAGARMLDPSLKAPALAEPVACRTVRERVERPDGSVVFKNRRECDEPGFVASWAPECRVVRERVVRPDGAVEHRSIRRCD